MAPPVESAPSSEEARVDDTKPRVYRTTALQFEMMLEYIERHPYMVRTVHYPQSVALREHHWKLLTERLNADDLKPHKTKARWKKTYFDWKSTVRAKLRSPAGQNALTPLDKRLIAVLRFLDSHQAPLARKDAMPQAEVVYKVGGSSNAVHIGWKRRRLAPDAVPSRKLPVLPLNRPRAERRRSPHSVGVPSPAGASSSAGPVSDPVQRYVESQDRHNVPTSESSISASTTMVQVPAGTASCEAPTLVLSDVRSLSKEMHTGVKVKLEPVDVDDVVVEEFDDASSEVDANGSQPITGAEASSPPFFCARQEDQAPSRPLDDAGTDSTPSGNTGSESFPADGAGSQDDLKTKLDFQIFSATKRKLEAEERRADAEAEFYRQEIKRSMALASLHAEEQRKIAAVADVHVEERRQAAAKVEMLLEHKKFYVEQQKTEVLKRRLLQLEIKKIKLDLSKDTDAE
ncbi:uncharacterized protein LOC119396692 isoform X2 [Rhipicephalus sanguineus]|uniref:uncharacterized protein LOC119396692 isoform X2 n=1 Tax=Rhipicephalus sanguineus TaxID=34632 RepID=UPI001893AD31|nr:uncharacterized protein LOC119396692 isoform X2 [Rhipicephalus sanguineus]